MSFNYQKILKFPEKSRIDKRLPKAFFLRNFELTANEKKTLNTKIKSLIMLASLKNSNTNIATFSDKNYIFEEIQIVICTLDIIDFEDYKNKSIDLIQKKIPYPILLIVECDNEFVINICNKRRNQNDNSKLTVENQFTTSNISKLYKNDITTLFWNQLSFASLDKTNMQTVYKSYEKAIVQYRTANLTGVYKERNKIQTQEDIYSLEKIDSLETQIISLANRIKKENSFSNKINLNVEIHNLRDQIEELKEKLR